MALGLWLAWPRVIPTSLFHRDGAPPVVEVTVALPAPSPVPAPSVLPIPPAPAPEPQLAALPPAPVAIPAPPAPPPFVADRKAIARAQFYLDQLGYQIGVADGAMGRRTKVAIAAFRKTNALPKGEEVDAALIDALDFAVAQLPKTKPAEGVPAAAPRIPVARAPLSN